MISDSAKSTLGLPDEGLKVNGLAVGWLVPYDGNVDSSSINAHLPKPMSIIGDFIQISSSDLSFQQIKDHKADFNANPTQAVYMASIMPISGLRDFGDAEVNAIAENMAKINETGQTVYLRFAFIFNLDCFEYCLKPELFVAAWRKLTKAVRLRCANLPGKTYMMWSPCIEEDANGSIPEYASYFPGVEWVDVTGPVLKPGEGRNVALPSDYFKRTFGPFYATYGEKHNLPCIISEAGIRYLMDPQTQEPRAGGASEVEMKMKWIDQIITSAADYPNLKGFVWFEYDKQEGEDYTRCSLILGTKEVREAALAKFK